MESITTPEVDIVFKLVFTKEQKKELDVQRSEEVNGLYIYNYGQILINVTSEDFKESKEEEIVDLFTKVSTHEMLHHVIYKITDNYSNDTEDHFILIMAGQEEWM